LPIRERGARGEEIVIESAEGAEVEGGWSAFGADTGVDIEGTLCGVALLEIDPMDPHLILCV